MRFVLLDENGVMVQIIIWDGVTDFTPPAGHSLIPEADYRPPPDEEK